MTPRQVEQLEILDGSRSVNARFNAAVRRADMLALLTIPSKIQSAQATAAPTQAEYNALQADVAAIHKTLRAVADALAEALR